MGRGRAVSRRRRFIPDPTKIILLAGAAVFVVALIGFTDLGLRKSAALAEQRRALAELATIRDQKRQLTRALEEARQGENIAPLAYRYFGRTLPGSTVVQFEVEEPAGSQQSEGKTTPNDDIRPAWIRYWEQIAQFARSLTSGENWVQ
jgi:hypothetical protein